MSDKLKVVDEILSDLQSHLQRCVPDPADRERGERLCYDLRLQYEGTMEAWGGTLEHSGILERRLEDRDSQIESLKARIESLEAQIARLLGHRRGP